MTTSTSTAKKRRSDKRLPSVTITISGTQGAGKSTIARILADALHHANISYTSECAEIEGGRPRHVADVRRPRPGITALIREELTKGTRR